MNYDYTQIYNYNKKRTKTYTIFLSIAIILSLIIVLCCCLPTFFAKTNYFGEPFNCGNLEITISEIKEIDQENGSFSAAITLLIKNIAEETIYFNLDDIFLKNEETQEEHTMVKLFSPEILKGGESEEYKIEFTIPSSISSQKYILHFDFDNEDAKCALYYENNEMLKIESFRFYYDHNIQILSSYFGTELAENILLGLEKTNAIKDNTRLNSDFIIKRDEKCYEIYADISIVINASNEQFKILTYETVYAESTAILLYDSTLPSNVKMLSEEERKNLKSTQRKYQVQSTIDISPSFGVLLHDKFGNTHLSFSINNKSDSSFVYVEITFQPSFPGYESKLNKKSYTSWDEIQAGKSKTIELKTTDWNNYDFFEVTNIIILFGDGTSIQFNEYDCQFLRD